MPEYAATTILLLMNLLLGWLDGKHLLIVPDSDLSAAVSYGLYAGEFLFAMLWLALGPENLLRRSLAVLNWGLWLSILSWTGYFIARGERTWSYSREIGHIVTMLPLAVVLGSAPLFLFRIKNALVFEHDKLERRRLVTDIGLLLLTFLSIAVPLSVSRTTMIALREDAYYASELAYFMGTFGLFTIPSIVFIFLGKKIRYFLAIAAMALALAVSLVIAWFNPVSSGVSGRYVFPEAAILSSIAFSLVSLLTFNLRIIGFRLRNCKK